MSDPNSTPNLALTSYVTVQVARTQNKLNAQASHILREHSDLTLVEWRILQLLHHYDGATISKLAGEVQMDKGQLSRKVSDMVAKDLVVSVTDDVDHRRHHLHLTKRAIEISRKIRPIMERRQVMLVQDASAADLQVFFDVLGKINAAAECRDVE